jgi:hypothetical protein
MNNVKFRLWDFLANVIPGAIFLVFVSLLLPSSLFSSLIVFADGVLGFFLFLVISYVLGLNFQWLSRILNKNLRGTCLESEDYFRDYLKSGILSESEDDTRQKFFLEAQKYFWDEEFVSEDLQEDDGWYYELRSLTEAHLYDNDIGKSKKFHMLYVMMRSLSLVFLSIAILNLLYILLAGLSILDWRSGFILFLNLDMITLGILETLYYNSVSGVLGSIVGALISLVMLATSFKQKEYYLELFSKWMVRDFYASEVS